MSSFSGALAVRPPCCPTLTSQDELVPPESSVNRATDRSFPDRQTCLLCILYSIAGLAACTRTLLDVGVCSDTHGVYCRPRVGPRDRCLGSESQDIERRLVPGPQVCIRKWRAYDEFVNSPTLRTVPDGAVESSGDGPATLEGF